MADTDIIINNTTNDTDVIINTTTENISVIIDTESPNLSPISDLINNLLNNYSKLDSVATSVINNSAAWFNYEEIEEVNIFQSLSSTWVETNNEMNTLQNELSGFWQQTAEAAQLGIIDAGFF
jgi:hypothetical protein